MQTLPQLNHRQVGGFQTKLISLFNKTSLCDCSHSRPLIGGF
ncbi:hypothetical protein ACFOG5_19105 [Pedobacter fastidiosus]